MQQPVSISRRVAVTAVGGAAPLLTASSSTRPSRDRPATANQAMWVLPKMFALAENWGMVVQCCHVHRPDVLQGLLAERGEDVVLDSSL